MYNFSACVLILAFFCSELRVDCKTTAEVEDDLVLKLTKHLTKHATPPDMVNQTVYLYVDLVQLLNIDEKNGLVTLQLRILFYYKSTSAKWNPRDFYNYTLLFFPKDTFWTPDIGETFQTFTIYIDFR